MSSIIAGPATRLTEDLVAFVQNGVIAAAMFGIAYYAGLRIFGLTRAGAAVITETQDMPRAVRTAGLVVVAAFIASVSM
jgi:divalent metal cation (Fe/Co/Zn/Cd) transporter